MKAVFGTFQAKPLCGMLLGIADLKPSFFPQPLQPRKD